MDAMGNQICHYAGSVLTAALRQRPYADESRSRRELYLALETYEGSVGFLFPVLVPENNN